MLKPEQLVRVSVTAPNDIAGGFLFHLEAEKDAPKRYWVEMWANRASVLARKQYKEWIHNDWEKTLGDPKLHFELSDPRIRRCYFYRDFTDVQAGKVRPRFPEPAYIHPQ
jgi:hypothetical protein